MWRSSKDSCTSNENVEETPGWLDQWTTPKQCDRRARISSEQRDPIRIVEIDTSGPYSCSAPNFPRAQNHYQQQKPSSQYVLSPLHRAHHNLSLHSNNAPSPSKVKCLQLHSVSPRCLREQRNYPTAQTPNLRSIYCYGMGVNGDSEASTMPNYMAATLSTKARVRSQSAPRHRPLTPEREKIGSAKKRLSFPAPDPQNGIGVNGGSFDHNLRSPSRKSTQGGHIEMEQTSNMSSCCVDSLGDEISPPSIKDLRRWLR